MDPITSLHQEPLHGEQVTSETPHQEPHKTFTPLHQDPLHGEQVTSETPHLEPHKTCTRTSPTPSPTSGPPHPDYHRCLQACHAEGRHYLTEGMSHAVPPPPGDEFGIL